MRRGIVNHSPTPLRSVEEVVDMRLDFDVRQHNVTTPLVRNGPIPEVANPVPKFRVSLQKDCRFY